LFLVDHLSVCKGLGEMWLWLVGLGRVELKVERSLSRVVRLLQACLGLPSFPLASQRKVYLVKSWLHLGLVAAQVMCRFQLGMLLMVGLLVQYRFVLGLPSAVEAGW
jgi:hypothetical protein